jgi:hypothetical protein
LNDQLNHGPVFPVNDSHESLFGIGQPEGDTKAWRGTAKKEGAPIPCD